MPRYRIVNSRAFIGGRMYEVGEELEYSGEPGVSLMPLDNEGRAAKLRLVLSCRQSAPALMIGGAHRFNIRLAKSLGAGELASYQDYSNFIEAWVATARAAQEA